MGVLLVVGVGAALRWGDRPYVAWRPTGRLGGREEPGDRPGVREPALQYLRGVAVAVVGGFWAGLLVTGPAVRLIMRLLAVTGGDDAQGRITEADEVVGAVTLDGTVGLLLFGGVLPGLVSGVLYLLLRRWLPTGRLAGVAFGALHLVVAATRLDPLRPDNPDFDLVGPGWLSVLTFAATAMLHGMAVVAFCNHVSERLPPPVGDRRARFPAALALVLPLVLLLPTVVILVPILVGLLATVALAQLEPVARVARSRHVLLGGRVLVVALVLALLPSAVLDLHDIVVR